MNLTPLHLMLLLHHYTTPGPWPQAGAPAVLEYTDDLERMGLIKPRGFVVGLFDTTDKGGAYVAALRSVPLPEARWVLPAQEERSL